MSKPRKECRNWLQWTARRTTSGGSAVVCDADTGEVFGDLALHLGWESQTAEVGYTFAREHWGKGYAVEALEALVEYLFEQLNVTRVFGSLHPDNPASAMVLERVGMLFEGHTKSSFWIGGRKLR